MKSVTVRTKKTKAMEALDFSEVKESGFYFVRDGKLIKHGAISAAEFQRMIGGLLTNSKSMRVRMEAAKRWEESVFGRSSIDLDKEETVANYKKETLFFCYPKRRGKPDIWRMGEKIMVDPS
jgi:hypothetical protein